MITIIYVLIKLFFIDYHSIYQGNEKEFILKVSSISASSNQKKVIFEGKEKILSYIDNAIVLEIGNLYQIKGTLIKPSSNTIPNTFNYQEYLAKQKIYYLLDVEEINLINKTNNLFAKTKNFFNNKINSYQSHKYLQAFILGNTSYITKDIKNKYQLLGISHLFAISGMHVSLLIAFLSFFMKKANIKENSAIIIKIIFLLFYAFLVNFQISIMRSILNYIFMTINKIFKLKLKKEKIFFIVLCITLWFNPFNLYNVGFQYSYLISFILIKYGNLIKGNYFKKMFITSLLAFIGSLPLTILYNYQINWLTPIYNLIYVPLISVIVFPMSILCFIFPYLDNIFLYLANILEKMVSITSNYTWVTILSKPSLFLILIYLFFIFYFFEKWQKKQFIKMFSLIILIIFHYNINAIIPNNMIIFFDVNQGDCGLLNLNNQVLLVDTGGNYFREYYQNIIIFMKSQGFRKINYMVLTHGDYDHMGEAKKMVENFEVENVIFNCGKFNELEQELIKVLNKKNIPYYNCIKELNIGDNKLYFLNNGGYDNENDNSSIIYAKFYNYKFLFMGDAGIEVEEDLIRKHNLQNIDILKVGHHGSKTSSSKKFISTIKPHYSIISVGKNNRYGHPNNNVLDNLENSKIYRTDQDGSVMFKINKNKLNIETFVP